MIIPLPIGFLFAAKRDFEHKLWQRRTRGLDGMKCFQVQLVRHGAAECILHVSRKLIVDLVGGEAIAERVGPHAGARVVFRRRKRFALGVSVGTPVGRHSRMRRRVFLSSSHDVKRRRWQDARRSLRGLSYIGTYCACGCLPRVFPIESGMEGRGWKEGSVRG